MACMGQKINTHGFGGTLYEVDSLEGVSIDWMIILKDMFKKIGLECMSYTDLVQNSC
jgi:hypothetical protein